MKLNAKKDVEQMEVLLDDVGNFFYGLALDQHQGGTMLSLTENKVIQHRHFLERLLNQYKEDDSITSDLRQAIRYLYPDDYGMPFEDPWKDSFRFCNGWGRLDAFLSMYLSPVIGSLVNSYLYAGKDVPIDRRFTLPQRQDLQPENIATLGPARTDSYLAASFYRFSVAPDAHIGLHPTFEEALGYVVSGLVDCGIVPTVYTGSDNFVFGKRYDGIEIVDTFVLSTDPMVLLKRKDVSDMGSVTSHPAVRHLVDLRYDFVPSKSKAQAVVDCLNGVADGVLTSLRCYEPEFFDVVKQFDPVPMSWSVFARSEI